MKKILTSTAITAFIALTIVSCTKTSEVQVDKNALSAAEVSMIKAAGFESTGAIRVDSKYLIESDILLTADELRSLSSESGPELIVANTEQYRTTKLVTGLPRNIKVRYTGSKQSLSNAVTNAVARYNAQNLQLTFQKVTSGAADIVVSDYYDQGLTIAFSGFPSGGNPYNSVKFNTFFANWSSNTLTTVLAHEMGHCIGFRHTDYMDRSYSCGGGYSNEGKAGIGAIRIPGTPAGPEPNSWMLACLNNGINRPFDANDRVALNYLY